jgi:predicted metal-dependent hydrolase
MHPIPVRTMRFTPPTAADFHPLYIANNSALSYSHTAMGLYAAYLEPFLVKSVHRVADRIRDAALREDVDRFCRQEAQHYQQHVDFNRIVVGHGYPGLEERLETLKRDFDGFLSERDDRFRLGYIEGFESYTTQAALRVLQIGWYDRKRTIRVWGDLFKWHMLEEIEHRHVAFDLYQHLYGDHFHRARMCWFAQRHMFRFFDDVMHLMSSVDVPRHGPRCRITPKARFLLALTPLPLRARTMLPGYSPHRHHIPERVARLSAHFNQRAEQLR